MPDILFLPTLEDIIIGYLSDKEKGLTPGYFKQFYLGDPLDIPTSILPCVSVEAESTEVKAGPTGMDEVDTTIAIKLMYNKRNDFGSTDSELLGYRKLREFAEARDPVSKEYADTCVMGILRKYFTLSNADNTYNVLDQLVSINYGIVARARGMVTAEAQIKVKFHQLLTVTGRQ